MWEYKVIDNFFPECVFQDIKELADREKDNLRQFGYNTKSGHYVRWTHENLIPSLVDHFHEFEVKRKYHAIVKAEHWSIHPPNFYYPKHIDAGHRIMTSVLYIHPEDNNGTVLYDGDEVKEIEWKPNRLFLHCSLDNVTYHDYRASKQRITYNCFYIDPFQTPEDRIERRYFRDVAI